MSARALNELAVRDSGELVDYRPIAQGEFDLATGLDAPLSSGLMSFYRARPFVRHGVAPLVGVRPTSFMRLPLFLTMLG